tara:strand:+ start:227 stop:646 length:420 start_codon:yes stop_codon:yes gene_type:complete
MPDFKKKSKGFDIKSKKAKNKRPNYGVKNTGNFMNLEEYGYGPADNIDFQKGTGSIGDAVLPSDKNPKKKKSSGFKMKGYTYSGTAPTKNKTKYSKEAQNLLKYVPNKEAYDALPSDEDRRAFDVAAKAAGLPTKKEKA